MDIEPTPARSPPVTLPPVAKVAPGVLGGRVPREGYQRGWGLQYGGLEQQVQASVLYREAVAAAAGIPSHVGTAKKMNLFLLITCFFDRLQHHDIVEFGTYKGGSAVFMAHLLRALHPDAKLYALDTFEGMPETDKTRDAHNRGDFADASLSDLEARRDELGLTNLVFVKGLFQDTFPDLARTGARFGLAHIDCDIYTGVKYAQEAVWDHMTPGGYVAYDDADISSCIGATDAVEELIMDRRVHSEQIWPHFVFRAHLDEVS